MFEFGRDLRKLFEKARESDDLDWLELIGSDLVAREARSQSTDAGRVSCARPFEAWMRASALWREHARRTGEQAALDRAASAASDAQRHARPGDQANLAAVETAEIHLLRFDLFGGLPALAAAESALPADPERRSTVAAARGVSARLAARRAHLSDDPALAQRALADFDGAVDGLTGPRRDEARLERAGLAFDLGVRTRDAVMLDRAGRDLRDLVETAPADRRPITRARALILTAAGLRALSALADNDMGLAAGRMMFEAAADQFTPDHSPLDWVAVQLAWAGDDTPLHTWVQAETLTREPGLILGALARERRLSAEIALAETATRLDALHALAERLHARLRAGSAPLDWAADQIALARIALSSARLSGGEARAVGLMLTESAETAREWGVPALAHRADSLRSG